MRARAQMFVRQKSVYGRSIVNMHGYRPQAALQARDAAPGSGGVTLDRIHNAGGCERDDVRCANPKVQNNNRKNNIILRHSKTG